MLSRRISDDVAMLTRTSAALVRDIEPELQCSGSAASAKSRSHAGGIRDHAADVSSQVNRGAHPRSIARRLAERRHAYATSWLSAWVERPWPPLARLAAGVGGALVVIAAVSWPLLFANATFNNDWLNHLWYMWHESVAIREQHVPSLFLDYSRGIFYPVYAFYGGTLYALVGTLSLALGDAPLQTYILTYLLGFGAAYGGWYWTARSFGVRGWRAHIPGIVFVTSASYLTTVYVLGDWPEFTAVSMMPLMIAAGLSVLRAQQLRFGPATALAVSSIVFFGSHLITLVWGASTLAVVGVALLACVPAARAAMTRAGVLRVAAIMVPGLLVSAWFLLPTAAYESHTLIAHTYPHFRTLLRETMFTVAAPGLFKLSRSPTSGSIVSLALPILAIAWVTASIAMLVWSGRRGTWMRAALVIATATAALTVLMTHAGLILALPRIYSTLQFGFRIESFVLLGISGALLAVLAATADAGPRLQRWAWLLAPIALVSVIGAVEQTVAHPHGQDRSTALASFMTPVHERLGQLDYLDHELPSYSTEAPFVAFPVETAMRDGRVTEVVPVPPNRLIATNIRGGPDLVKVTGARIVGHNPETDDVLELTSASAASPAGRARATAIITVAPADSFSIVGGRVISLLALAALGAQLGWIGVGGARRRRGERAAGAVDG
jgi:hypothetical protein